jgi:hypothetical protein
MTAFIGDRTPRRAPLFHPSWPPEIYSPIGLSKRSFGVFRQCRLVVSARMRRYTDSFAFSADGASRRRARYRSFAVPSRSALPTGTIMNSLHWTAVLVVSLLGGGLAVAALIIAVVTVAIRVATQLFDDEPD